MLEIFLNILTSTPLYAWAIFCYLLLVGFKATKNRIVYLPKLLVIPLVLLGLKYQILFSEEIWLYLGFVLMGFLIGLIMTTKSFIKILKDSKSIELPGSYSVMVILLLFFTVKYIFGYLNATDFDLYTKYLFVETSISGLISGYFLGKLAYYLYRYVNC